MPAASEVPPQLKPKPTKTVDAKAFKAAITTLRQLDGRIPKDVTEKAIHLLFSTNLLPGYDLSQAHVIELPSTNVYSLILPLTPSSRYQMPRPFKGSHNHTWALLRGINIGTSQIILLEGKIRLANWQYNKKAAKCDVPSFGAFYIGKEVANTDIDIPQWATKELMDTMQKRGEGQQEVIVGAMFTGACQHTAYKAGGNEMAQIQVAEKGVVTTSEKYTIAHSHHVGLKFVALTWKNLPSQVDAEDSSSENLNYRIVSLRGLRIDTQAIAMTISRTTHDLRGRGLQVF